MTKNNEEFITVSEAIKRYKKLSRHKIYYYIEKGVIEAEKLVDKPNSKMYISVLSIPAFLRQ